MNENLVFLQSHPIKDIWSFNIILLKINEVDITKLHTIIKDLPVK